VILGRRTVCSVGRAHTVTPLHHPNHPKGDTGMTDTQTQGIFEDTLDIHALSERWSASRRQATEHLLDLYEKSVGRLADAHVQSARAVDNPTLVTIAETQATLSRDVVDAFATSVRKLLDL
jgi:hypothetical protein